MGEMADEIPATPEQFKKMLEWWQEHQPWYVTEFRLTTLMPNLRMGFISLRQEQRGNDEPLLLTYVDEQHIEMNGGLSMTQDQAQRFIMDLNDTKQLVMAPDTG